MLVDPAVIDAVASVAADNPGLSLGDTPGSPSGTPSASPSAAAGDASAASRTADPIGPADRANATRWLAQVKTASTLQTVLGLGYADPDTAALARQRPSLVGLAAKESATAFEQLGIDALPTVAPASGWLDDEALPAVPKDTMVLVSDHAAPRTRNHWRTPEGQDRPRPWRRSPSASGSSPTPRSVRSTALAARWSSTCRPAGTRDRAGRRPTSSPG
jgi:hypothetical protein